MQRVYFYLHEFSSILPGYIYMQRKERNVTPGNKPIYSAIKFACYYLKLELE